MRNEFKKGDWIVIKEYRSTENFLWLADEDGAFHGHFNRHAMYHDFTKMLIHGIDGLNTPYNPEIHGMIFVSERLTLVRVPDELARLDKNTPGGVIQVHGFPMLIEDYIKDLRALAFQMLENGHAVPGYKLVAKRGTRQWTDEEKAKEFLLKSFVEPYKELEVISPAQAEKMLKKIGGELPKELVVSISSGSTLALDTDPRPAVLQIGKQLTAALSKLQ